MEKFGQYKKKRVTARSRVGGDNGMTLPGPDFVTDQVSRFESTRKGSCGVYEDFDEAVTVDAPARLGSDKRFRKPLTLAQIEEQEQLAAEQERREREQRRAAAKPKPPEPVEPNEVRCKHCGEMLWSVTGPNGSLLEIDRFQIETQIGMDGRVRRLEMPARSAVCNDRISEQGGYRLHDPQWFNGWDGDKPGWLWGASRMSLEDAEVFGVVIYSEHTLTCEVVPDNVMMSKATNVALEGDAAGNREGKRVYALPPEMQAERNTWLKFPAKMLKPRKLSALKPVSQTQCGMPLFAEHGASRVKSSRSPATESSPLEAGRTQLTLSLEHE